MADGSVVQNAVENTGENGNQQGEQQSPAWKTMLWQMATFWIVMQVVKSFTGKKQAPASTDVSSTTGGVAGPARNMFSAGDKLELSIYLSESQYFDDFSNETALIWKQTDLVYGNWYDGPNSDGMRTISGKIPAPANVMNNGSLYYHVYILKHGYSLDSNSKFYSKFGLVNASKLVTVYKPQRVHKTKNLITGEPDSKQPVVKANSSEPPKIISFWHPNITINLLDDHTPWTNGSVPAPIDKYIEFMDDVYKPVLYVNDYWNYMSDYMPINETTPTLEFCITFSPISMFRWQMYISQDMRSQWNKYLGDSAEHSDQEQDMLKRTMQETNPYLLALTMIVSLVHSVFEFLAFKNDIQFWKTRKSLEGLSVRSVFFNVFQSLIVLLYVLDNETNTVVVISCFVGLLIECWKITKVVDIKLHPTDKWGPFPAITMTDKSTYVESETKVYDRLAFKYLSWLLFPLLGCYMVYSLFFNEHKGWYSFVLNIAYGFLLTFGFIMMTPQLFINYKLKSVAHLPWRMLTYKALNTFIDDIFAFVIKMPTLYRIGCLRDDVIFFIFLYQRYIYRIDMTRVNEFGVSGEEPTDESQAKDTDSQNTEQAIESKKEQ